jgi:membrane protein
LLNLAFSFGVITVLFAMIFKILPDVKIAWRDVWIGSVFTALLFTAGKFALGLYLGNNSTVSAYGAAGSLLLILLWENYSAQILFFGAELTEAYANRYGVQLEPKAHAEWARDARCAVRQNKAAAPAPQPKSRAKPRDRKLELVEELKKQVHSLRAAASH